MWHAVPRAFPVRCGALGLGGQQGQQHIPPVRPLVQPRPPRQVDRLVIGGREHHLLPVGGGERARHFGLVVHEDVAFDESLVATDHQAARPIHAHVLLHPRILIRRAGLVLEGVGGGAQAHVDALRQHLVHRLDGAREGLEADVESGLRHNGFSVLGVLRVGEVLLQLEEVPAGLHDFEPLVAESLGLPALDELVLEADQGVVHVHQDHARHGHV
mmetsp:Transcript_26227/g.83822  ORF Transcript_26227/g.83822 Transcript_26227/m.83822 type:complete len:215 (-) Transcript_26227:139-783(-)